MLVLALWHWHWYSLTTLVHYTVYCFICARFQTLRVNGKQSSQCSAVDGSCLTALAPSTASIFASWNRSTLARSSSTTRDFSVSYQYRAVVDADYQFLYVDVGAEGRMSDGGVFAHCSLFTALEDRLLNIPDAEPLSNTCHMAVPYYLAGDEAFPLKPFLMKPYSRRALTVEEQTCNYRFSRGRVVVEHAFGMLASVFRILHTPIHLQPQKAELIVLAVCVLHNFLRQRCKNAYLPPVAGSIGPTVEGLVPLEFTQHRNATNAAKEVRDVLKQYFMTEGQLSWQQERLLQF